MPTYAGTIWRSGEPREGWVRVAKGRVVDEGEGAKGGAEAAVILDGLYDYHTHVGDAFLRGRRLPHSLDRLVRPPHGLKHRMLAKARPAQLVAGIRRALLEYAEAGTRAILDFREQGLVGLRIAKEAAQGLEGRVPRLHLLGRPVGPTTEEIEQVLRDASGLALSAARDVGVELVAQAASACRRAKKPFAIHASESRREPIQPVLEARPDLLVHLVKATPADLRRVQDAGVPVAVCPSSNAFFRLRAPVQALHKAGISFFFGTDNAMLGNRDIVEEAARAHALAPEIPDEALLAALTTPIEKGIKRLEADAERPRAAERLAVLDRRGRRVRWTQPARIVTR